MDGTLSPRSQAVFALAREEAKRLHHEYIGTEHILLGILGEGQGNARGALTSAGITLEDARTRVERVIGIGPNTASPDDRGLSPRARKVITVAQTEAKSRQSSVVDPEHLLLGLSQDQQCVAALVLRDLQFDPDRNRS
jgi:ATP-dependent Clp protease ATP-binding subunit ClpC